MTIPDAVELLRESAVAFAVDFEECCRNSDDKQMTTPRGTMISGNGECAEWLIPGGTYLLVKVEMAE